MRVDEQHIDDVQEWIDKYNTILSRLRFGKYVSYAVPFDDMLFYRIQGFFFRENRKGSSISIFIHERKWFAVCSFGRPSIVVAGDGVVDRAYVVFSNDIELWLRIGIVSRLLKVRFPIVMSKFRDRGWVLLISRLWERYTDRKISLSFGRWVNMQSEVKEYKEYALSHFTRHQKAKLVDNRRRKVEIGPLS